MQKKLKPRLLIKSGYYIVPSPSTALKQIPSYSLALVYLIPSLLVWAEIECTVRVAQTAHKTSSAKQAIEAKSLQVNLFQKHLFLHQLTHNMTKDCSLIYQFSA